MPTPRDATVEINGLTLHYLEWNPEGTASADRTVLLLHGSNGNAHVWDAFAALIGADVRTIALDLRGHGESEWPQPPAYGCEHYASDIEQLIARLNLRRVVLIAHSMAVYHSIRCANFSPDRVHRLVLIDIEAAAREEHVRLLRGGGAKPEPIYESVEEALARERRYFPFANEHTLRAFVATNLRQVHPHEPEPGVSRPALTYKYDRATLAQFEAYDEWARLKQLRCPTLFIYGEHSPTARPEVIKKMVEAVPGSRSVKIEQAAHMLHIENPHALYEAIMAFCLELPMEDRATL